MIADRKGFTMVEYTELPAVPGRVRASMAGCGVTSTAIYTDVGTASAGHVEDNSMSVASVLTSTTLTQEADEPCAECGLPIIDRFYLFALERRWHNSCLGCSVCRRRLESEGSCYVKDGQIFCKEDYFRRFGAQKCARCYESIQSGEMVMRAQASVYHVKCFTCAICSSTLHTGDHFGIFDNKIYCRNDFEQLQYAAISAESAITSRSSQCNGRISANISPESINMISSSCNGAAACPPSHCLNGLTSTSSISPVNISANTNFEDLNFGDYPPPLAHPGFLQEPPANNKTQRQRKRRQNESNTNTSHVNRTTDQQWQLGLSIIDTEAGYHHTSGQSHHVKQKRMRTSFKHHQLKIMKQYFTINHNPDAKDLKQLSLKTGLSKRVLQVWFQNARAKFRRGQGEGGKEDGTNDGGDNSLNDDSTNSNEEMISDTESQDMDSTTSIRSHSDDMVSSSSPLHSLGNHLDSLPAISPSPLNPISDAPTAHSDHSSLVDHGLCL